jgi:protein TonB
MLDPQAVGHRLYVTFEIDRDGSVTHIQIAQPSGDATLDRTGLSAVQHVDNFPPLPEAYSGTHLNVTYYFDPPQHP